MKVLALKIREAALSVLPVMAIVIIMYFLPFVSLSTTELAAFLCASVALVVGVGFFNLGADIAMSPMGQHIGTGLSKTRKAFLLLSVTFIMGVLITVAEPDLSVLAGQVSDLVKNWILIAVVGVGVGLFLTLSIVRTVKNKPLPQYLMFFYLALFALVAVMIVREQAGFTALAFDSGGVTTGPITVPFLMALGIGIASTVGSSKSAENNFGSIAMCSVGPVIAVVIIGIFSRGSIKYTLNASDYSVESQLGSALYTTILHTMSEVALALGLICAMFLILQVTILKLPVKKLLQMLKGVVFTFIGLVIFMTAAKVGFMPVGFKFGQMLADTKNHPAVIIIFGFITGMATVLAEPAVHVLNNQVERVTDGAISKKSMMIALSIGVGISIALSMVRMKYQFSILYYLIPGYIISLGLSLLVPGIYTAIAFDSGGVASGPLTSTFILPFAIGACAMMNGADRIPFDAFGIVAMVAMTPLITIQLLGFKAVLVERVKAKRAMKRIFAADDEQIIEFM
ncbi:MAG: DUF1538 domain-containing protein [Clostridia bacterium]|nr:DUF1538 domain-containing protein [Clostridia bacterium]